MRIEPTAIEGVFVVALEPHRDERGFFARSYCQDSFAVVGIELQVRQINLSQNFLRGTLRGLHWQAAPRADRKLVSCVAGAIWDVVVDLRPDSSTYTQWIAAELSAANYKAMYVPPGCAHGFLTLADDSMVQYVMGEAYVPDLARGARWDDPTFGIAWPFAPSTINNRDADYPDWRV